VKKVLITGATGTVGNSVLKALIEIEHELEIFAGVRDKNIALSSFKNFKAKPVKFDFTDSKTFRSALEGIDYLFLLRPPQISEVKTYFKPLLETAKKEQIQHIVFVSVQGVQHSKWIPHHKI
jgi:uncharacterized protein YbjT (DUF2867 family)